MYACVREKQRQSSKTLPLQHSNALHMWAETLQYSCNCKERKKHTFKSYKKEKAQDETKRTRDTVTLTLQ